MGVPIGIQICPNACQIPSKSDSGNRLRSKRAQTMKMHIVVHFGMIFRGPSLPKSLVKCYPKSLFVDPNKPRSHSRRDLQNCMQKGAPFFQKLCKVTPQGIKTETKIYQKSHFGASETPQLQPTGPRDAQEEVNHLNWSQKSLKNDPRTLKSIAKILSEKPNACQKRGRRQWA